jgi:hypothetical protein
LISDEYQCWWISTHIEIQHEIIIFLIFLHNIKGEKYKNKIKTKTNG